MLKLKYDPVHGYDYSYNAERLYIPDYRIHRPYDFYFDWPWRYRVWLPNRAYRRYLNKELRMLQLQYDLQPPYIPYRNVIDYEHVPYTKYPSIDIPNYRSYRLVDRYDTWPSWYQAYLPFPEFRNYLNNLLMRDLGKMLGVQYEPRYGIIDHEYWPYSKYVSVDIPEYRVTKPMDYYDKWPAYYPMYLPIPEFRRYLNNLLLRDMRNMIDLETRYDPIHGYNYTYWPDSKYFRNYRFSPPISWYDNWSHRSRVWFPYYWSTNRLFQHYMDYAPSNRSLREQRKTIYLDNSYPIKAVDYTYYPYSYKHYRPLSLYYDYYWPLSSLNRYYWPRYPYYRYLYYKYTLPSDRYYHLKGKMILLRDPISRVEDYSVYPTASYLRHKVYKPLSLYYDYYYPIRSLFWNSSYWPLYRSANSFINECKGGTGPRLQKIFDDETRLIRAQTASLLRRIHDPVPRVQRYSWPLTVSTRYYDNGIPARLSNDNYIHKLLITSSRNPKVEYTTYYTDPVRKYIGQGHLSCISYAGDRAYNRRPHIYLYEDPLKNDIQLLSFYINKFKQEKAITGSSAPEPTKADKVDEKPEITEITE